MFYNIYRKKSDEALRAIVTEPTSADDLKLCAIAILRERNVPVDDFIQSEDEIIATRATRIYSEISADKYSTGMRRLFALLIDGLALGLIGWFIQLLNEIDSVFFGFLLVFLKTTISYLYNILLHGCCGQTIGKMVMKIKIYDKSEKKQISYTQALLRDIVPLAFLVIFHFIIYLLDTEGWSLLAYISFVINFLMFFWLILEVVTMLFNSKKRALHDYIAKTVALKVKE